MTRETCELLSPDIMQTGRIPLGNSSGRPAIPPKKQILAFLWTMTNQEPARAVAQASLILQLVVSTEFSVD